MRLVSYDAGDGARSGVLEDERVIDACALLGEPHRAGLLELVAAGRVDDLRERLGDAGAPSHPRSAVSILPPIPDPDKIVVGLNYGRHAAEGGYGVPASPRSSAITATRWPPGRDGAAAASSGKVDYEAEVAFVVGRRAKAVAEADALEYVAATRCSTISPPATCSSRPPVDPARSSDGSAPCGQRGHPRRGRPHRRDRDPAHLNGEQMQRASTRT